MKHLKPTSSHGTVMAVSMMKDEAPFLLEWFAHHLAVGFTDILVYTNDCTDGTVEMLQRLEELGLGYHRENNIPEGIKPQPSAIKHAQMEPKVRQADWVLMFDADEFLCLNHPSGTLEGMLNDAVAIGANGIIITWRIFGSGGVVDWSRDPVTEQYLRSAPPLWNKGWGVKTLFKFDHNYWKLGIHRPSIKAKHLKTDFPNTVHWLNGSGQKMEEYFKFRGWRSIRRTLGYNWAQMNHYAVKSIDSYAVRKFRGNVNNKKDKYNADYWSLQDRNEVEDRNILRHSQRRAEIMAELLTDPVLSKYHYAALERVEARLDEYKQTEAYQQLRDSLIEAGKVPITQVEAKPPKPRDPAKIAKLMSNVEKKVANKPKEERRNAPVSGWGAHGKQYCDAAFDPNQEMTLEWVKSHDIDLPADPRVFTPEALNAVIAGKFQRRSARRIAGYITPHRKVMDVGTGIGFIPMNIRLAFPDSYVLAQDSRPWLIKTAEKIAARNDLMDTARLKLVDGPLSFEDGDLQGLNAYLGDFRPDCLRLNDCTDIDPEVLITTNLNSVRRIITPFSTEDVLGELKSAFAAPLKQVGFELTQDAEEGGSLMFDRTAK